MSKRADLLIACMLGNRWNATNSPVAGATATVQSPVAPDAQSRPHLETLIYQLVNLFGAGSLEATVSVNVSIASIAGTVVASFKHLMAPSSSANVGIANLQLAGKRGRPLFVSVPTVGGSVQASLTAAGWIEDTNG